MGEAAHERYVALKGKIIIDKPIEITLDQYERYMHYCIKHEIAEKYLDKQKVLALLRGLLDLQPEAWVSLEIKDRAEWDTICRYLLERIEKGEFNVPPEALYGC